MGETTAKHIEKEIDRTLNNVEAIGKLKDLPQTTIQGAKMAALGTLARDYAKDGWTIK